MRTLTMTRIGPWNVRLVFKGEAYGAYDCLTNDSEEPLVEFYDAEQNAAKFGPRGQFVSRYNASSIFSMTPGSGLCLYGGEPRWNVQANQMVVIVNWVTLQCAYEGNK